MLSRYSWKEIALLIVAWLFIVGSGAWWIFIFPLISPSADFLKHWVAARQLLAGQSPYYTEQFLGFNYPLIVGYLYIWLAPLTAKGAEHAWETFHGVLVIISAILIARYLRPKATPVAGVSESSLEFKIPHFLERHWWAFVFLVIVNYQPLHVVLVASNIEPLNLFLGTLFTILFIRKRDWLAGVALACFALIKLGPIMLLIPLFAIRRWRIIGGCLLVLTAYALFLLISGLWKTEVFLYTDVVPRLGYYWQGISVSVHRFFVSIFAPELHTDFHGYSRFVLVFNLCALALYGALVVVRMIIPDRDPEQFLAYGFFMTLLFSPLVEENHFIWAVGGMFLFIRAWAEGRLRSFLLPFLALAFGGMMCIRVLNQTASIFKLDLHHFWLPSSLLLYAVIITCITSFVKLPRTNSALPPS